MSIISIVGKAVKSALDKVNQSSSKKTTSSSSSSGGFSTPYGGYKAPQEYADAIKRVEASGGNFQNKEAAMKFKTENPGLFSQALSSQTNKSASSKPATYQEVLSGFFKGDPNAYAAAIKENEAAGRPHSNPTAAAAFMAAYPHLFAEPKQEKEEREQKLDMLNTGTVPPSFYIPLQQWFTNFGQTLNKDSSGNLLSSGGFSFAPGSYNTEDGQYMIDPITLAGAYLGQQPKQLTPELYDQYTDIAEKNYQPLHESRLNALKEVLGERTAATRRSAIARQAYDSPLYGEDLIREVEKPFAKEVSNLESDMASLINTAAMSQFNTDQAKEQALTANIVNFLLGLDNTQYNRGQDQYNNMLKLLPSLMYG
jgi:hypothetical protein